MALFPPGKGGGEGITYGYKGKGVTIHSLVDAKGMPLAIATGPANMDEKVFVEYLLEQIPEYPRILHADKGYDAQWLRDLIYCMGVLASISRREWPSKGTESINANYRWVVERTFSWFQRKFRRLNIRWERCRSTWSGLVNIAFIMFWVDKIGG